MKGYTIIDLLLGPAKEYHCWSWCKSITCIGCSDASHTNLFDNSD